MKFELIQWLSKDISENRNNFDTIISIRSKIYEYMYQNKLIINIPDEEFLMKLIKYIHRNSE
jgi:hypothetical protein